MKKYIFNVDNQDYNIEILSIENGHAQVSVNNEVMNILIKQGEVTSKPVAKAEAVSAPVAAAPAKTEKPAEEVKQAPVAQASAGGKVVAKLKAPLPGILIGIKVNVGDRVKEGDEVVLLEAMKMENSITSDVNGVVLAIKRNIGEAILQDEVLIEFGE